MEDGKHEVYYRAVPEGGQESEIKSTAVKAAPKRAVPEAGNITAIKNAAVKPAPKKAVPEGGQEPVKNTAEKTAPKKAVPKAGETAEAKNAAEKSTPKIAVPKAGDSKTEEKAPTAHKISVPDRPAVSSVHIAGYKGLNRRDTVDSGQLAEAKNIMFDAYPCPESCSLPKLNTSFDFIDADGNELKPGKIYDATTRGKNFFIICEAGFIYGSVEDGGKVQYISILSDMSDNKAEKHAKRRAVFAETVDENNLASPPKVNLCVYGERVDGDADENGERKYYIPILPSGSIDFVDSFLSIADSGKADKSRIYVVCGENGKASEVWKNRTKDSLWYELRRDIRLVNYDNKAGRYGEVQYRNGDIAGKYPELCKRIKTGHETIGFIDGELKGKSRTATSDDINGRKYFFNDGSIDYRQGIFNYEQTIAPIFSAVTFYKGRVFGVSGGFVVGGEYNKYNGWRLDTSGSISSAHAWLAASGANGRSGEDFSAIRVYMGRIAAFKPGFMHEVSGGSNPFYLSDIYSIGTKGKKSTAEAAGKLCFAAKNSLCVYSGAYPKIFGSETGVKDYENAVLGSDENKLYAYAQGRIFVYDFAVGVWSSLTTPCDISFFMSVSDALFALSGNGDLYKIDTLDNYGEWSFETEDMTENSLDIKRIQKIKVLFDIGSSAFMNVESIMSGGRGGVCYRYRNNTEKKRRVRGEIALRGTVDWCLRLRFSGKGYFKLLGLEIEMTDGGEIDGRDNNNGRTA